MFIDFHEEKVFNDTFQMTYDDIVEKYTSDPNYQVSYLEEFLDSMYIYQGQDAHGRGEIKRLRTEAIIAALETALDDIREGKIEKTEKKELKAAI